MELKPEDKDPASQNNVEKEIVFSIPDAYDDDFYDNTYDDVYDDIYNAVDLGGLGSSLSGAQLGHHPNSQPAAHSVKSYQPGNKLVKNCEQKINLGYISSFALTKLKVVGSSKVENREIRKKDKVEHATLENTLDPKTLNILTTLIYRKLLDSINGCVSTGKEANVYHALDQNGKSFALKVYKTSILTFKNREKYISGEFRYRNGVNYTNPRKMVSTWADKEFRNLSRMHAKGLPCPRPILRKENVLLMDFVGEGENAAPLLKNAIHSKSTARRLYRECLILMRELYTKCELVHADFSEYNMMLHNGKIVIIDVSQSVESKNDKATMFLKEDCKHVKEFFKRKGVAVMTVKEMFNFITDPTITDENIDEYLEEAQNIASSRSQKEMEEAEQNDQIFLDAYVPQRLDEIIKYEQDYHDIKSGKKESTYATITGLKSDLSGVAMVPEILEKKSKSKKEKLPKNNFPEKTEIRTSKTEEVSSHKARTKEIVDKSTLLSNQKSSGKGERDAGQEELLGKKAPTKDTKKSKDITSHVEALNLEGSEELTADDELEESDDNDDENAPSGSENDTSEGEEDDAKGKQPKTKHGARPRDESPNSRRERQRLFREEKREKRLTKMKKKEKRRLVKKGHVNKRI